MTQNAFQLNVFACLFLLCFGFFFWRGGDERMGGGGGGGGGGEGGCDPFSL